MKCNTNTYIQYEYNSRQKDFVELNIHGNSSSAPLATDHPLSQVMQATAITEQAFKKPVDIIMMLS